MPPCFVSIFGQADAFIVERGSPLLPRTIRDPVKMTKNVGTAIRDRFLINFCHFPVKLVLAVVVRKLEGNILVWYGFTKTPCMVINVESIVSDQQITWSMILNTIEAKIEKICCPIWTISVFLAVPGMNTARSENPMTAPAPEVATKPFVGSQPSEEARPSTLMRTPSEREPATETSSLNSIPIIRYREEG
ncbi:hypothetical protein EV363DRAFT_1153200 [Boletus edulis]|nr:hypothetical protein EV363DRAFT_1153200 [Boletus edulis]